MDEPAGTGRWLATLGRHPWYLAIMAVAALGLVAGSVTVLVQANNTPSPQAAGSNCGLINCGAAMPGPSATISTESHIGKAHTTVSHAPKPSASPTPSPSQAPTNAQASPLNVTLTFTAGQDQRDFGHFEGQLTLVNQGDSPVAGWTAELTLPGDEIFSVGNQDGRDGSPFDHWQFDGDTLTISADNSGETLSPGESMSLSIHGQGRTTSPTGCTFNGAACPTLRVGQQDPQPRQPQQQGPQVQQPQEQAAPDQPSSQAARSSSSQAARSSSSQAARSSSSQAAQSSSSQAAPSSPQAAPSSPQDQQPSPQDQQSSQDQRQGQHQRGQRSWPDDQQPSLWGWVSSGWR
jgi:Cellulose binding domain